MANEAAREETDRQLERTPFQWAQYWGKEVDAAQKRVRKFNTCGDKVVKKYIDRQTDNPHTFSLNLFHANVTTLKAMLCGSLPTVEVKREFSDPDDDQARVASNILERLLQQNIEASPTDFQQTLKDCLEDRLLPGIGTARVRYTRSAQVSPDGMIVPFEDAPIDYVHWKDLLWSFARTWSEVWWLSFRSYLTKEQAEERFGYDVCKDLVFTAYGPEGADDAAFSENELNDSEAKAEIWEIWSKAHRQVFWYSKGASRILDVREDTLKLNHFYPCPKPMFANLTTTQVMPKADYDIAKDLYEEIDVLQSRIAMITEAVKVVGVYDSTQDGISRMMTEGVENTMIPVDNWAMFGEKGGLKGTIDWFPVEEIAGVLNQLTQVRDNTIALLYQTTGMSDILRGQSEQYAGVGQEQIKEKYASVRVQALQDDFARFASDLQTIKAEVISKHFDPQSIAKQSNVQFMNPADQQLAMPAMQLIKSPDIFWRVEIRPESIAMVDYAQMQGERTQYLTATATYIQSAQALIKAIPQATPMLIALMKWGLAGFRGADEIEGVLDATLDAAQQAVQSGALGGQDDSQQNAEMQKEMAKIQGQMQLNDQKFQQSMQLEAHKAANQMKLEMLESNNNLKLEMLTHQSDTRRDIAKLQGDLEKIMRKLGADLQVEEAQSGYAMLERDTEHQHAVTESAQDHVQQMTEDQAQHEQTMAEIEAQNNARDTTGD